tara:strand:- start:125 stop:532 length:408 start_codon:yes stop_codon:yes gene_type:complete
MKKAEIEKTIIELAQKIDAPLELLPDYNSSRGNGHPHIEFDDLGLFHLVVSERGEEYDRKIINSENDLLYYVFSNITFQMASKFESQNRIEGQDFRRLLFDKQEDLLGKLNKEWKAKERDEHHNILKLNPFDDTI